jgi:AraC family transcriptional regulator, glycine betaine-responsive activator
MKNEKPSIFHAETAALDITFLVLPGASILCVASSIDPFRAANRIAGEMLYRWTIVSPDGANPATTCGLPVAVSGKFDANAHHEVLFVIAGFGAQRFAKGPFIAGLAKAGRRARAVGGIEAGTWLLGHAGLLEGRAATTHFEDMEDFRAAFPGTATKSDRYIVDGPVFTCGGASPAFDLMLHLIRARQGAAIAMNVSAVFVHDQTRATADTRIASPLLAAAQSDPRIAAAVRLMETHIDEPLAMSAIAARLEVTPRTLELAFKTNLSETPGHYYLGLRLAAARKMVTDTRLPMNEIAARTGFSSAAVFTRAFGIKFGRAPTSLR